MKSLKGHEQSLKYIDNLATVYDRYYLCCVLFKTQPDYALRLAKDVESVRYRRKEEGVSVKEMPGDLWACLVGKQNDDTSRRAKFGASMLRQEGYKKRGYRAQSTE
eukprot:Mrub_11925.p1 GENE.Mrub_11925~~Mrub_11925.p1  ORF type:complete len:106 (+),score=27.73 Mrub_11925:261-578(+)